MSNDNKNDNNNSNYSLYGLWRWEILFCFSQRPKVWLLGDQTKGQTGETDYGSGRTLNINNQPQHAQRHMLILFTWQEHREAARDSQVWTLVTAFNPNRGKCIILKKRR